MAQSAKPSRVSKRPAKAIPPRPSHAKLVRLAATHKPPQKWYDETDLPFTPTKD